ncbi:MAG TPA: hypothetical protein VI454_20410 [Verrucomicrobiae bacterium]|jgi:hypothetical protein
MNLQLKEEYLAKCNELCDCLNVLSEALIHTNGARVEDECSAKLGEELHALTEDLKAATATEDEARKCEIANDIKSQLFAIAKADLALPHDLLFTKCSDLIYVFQEERFAELRRADPPDSRSKP